MTMVVDQRTSLVDAAVELLTEGGLDALTTRALSERAGTTTMSIYSRFGGKDGVLAAVFDRGFSMLTEFLRSVPDRPDPLDSAVDACLAYRRFALDHPALYSVMVETEVSGFIGRTCASSTDAFDELARRVRASLPLDAEPLVPVATYSTWALCHGLVGIERTGIGTTKRDVSAEALFGEAIRRHLAGFGAG